MIASLFFDTPYIYDDTLLIENNPLFTSLQTFSDVLRFQLQPTKPVTNFWLASMEVLFPGSSLAQRCFSLLLHLSNIFLLYRLLRRREIEFKLAIISATWFAFAAVHSETIFVVQFRGELLAAFFLLLAMNFVRDRICFLSSLALVLGMLSKEILVISAIPVFFAFYRNQLSKKAWLRIVLLVSLVGVFVFVQLSTDALGLFSYSKRAGLSALQLPEHITLAARSVTEGVIKTVSGLELTTVRLKERTGVGDTWSVFLAALILSGWLFLFAWLSTRRHEFAHWLASAGVFLFSYQLIPNVNLGSEHYLYLFAVFFIPGTILMLDFGFTKFSIQRTSVSMGAIGCLLIFLSIANISLRLYEMSSPLRFYEAEREAYPKTSQTWTNLALALLRDGNSDEVERAGSLLEEARLKFKPSASWVTVANFYYFRNGNLAGMRALSTLLGDSAVEMIPSERAKIYMLRAEAEARQGFCSEASVQLNKGLNQVPGHHGLLRFQDDLKARISQQSIKCRS